MRSYLERMSLFLRPRFESYTKCLDIVRSFKPSSKDDSSTTRLLVDIHNDLPCGPGTPDFQYAFICAAGPYGVALTLLAVAAALLLKDDHGDTEDPNPPDDDRGEGGNEEDVGDGICYPEGETGSMCT